MNKTYYISVNNYLLDRNLKELMSFVYIDSGHIQIDGFYFYNDDKLYAYIKKTYDLNIHWSPERSSKMWPKNMKFLDLDWS